ncbi:AbrB/MazE/SpoVT family DNA-binding domain-containing protein [Brevibacillus borstelensis]
MKATGIVRKIDHLGRVVLPKELRTTLKINEGDPMEVYVNGETIVLRKYSPGCTLCGNVERPMTNLYQQKTICTACVDIIVNNQERLKAGAASGGGHS